MTMLRILLLSLLQKSSKRKRLNTLHGKCFPLIFFAF